MKKPTIPNNESSRIKSLFKLDVLDTPPDERFDSITRIAKILFDVPISLVSLVDSNRQWFKSRQGLDACETSRDSSFCAHAIEKSNFEDLQDRIFEVSDTHLDDRFSDNPLVTEEPYIRFYAGFVLQSTDGYNLGTLCIIDTKPRSLTDLDKKKLIDLGIVAQTTLQSLHHQDKDIVTGLYNRRGFLSIAEYMLATCKRNNYLATVIYFDLTNLTSITPNREDEFEKEVLQKFTSLLKECFKEADLFSRIDVSRFIVLTIHNKDTDVEQFSHRVKESIHHQVIELDEKLCLEFRSGMITSLPEYLKNTGRLIDLVDKRMHDSEYTYSYKL